MGLHGRLDIAGEIISKPKDGSKEKRSNEAWKNTQERVTVSTMFVFGVLEKREIGRSNI